jgi:hypothetical protein
MLRRVAPVRTYVSEELSASFIKVARIGELGTTIAVTSNRRTLRIPEDTIRPLNVDVSHSRRVCGHDLLLPIGYTWPKCPGISLGTAHRSVCTMTMHSSTSVCSPCALTLVP